MQFRAVGRPPLLPPGPFANFTCAQERAVYGAAPTLIYSFVDPKGTLKTQLLTPAGWITTDITMYPAAGWTNPDGSVLLLVADAAAVGQQPSKYTLRRINGDGSSTLACAACASVPLLDAFRSIVPTPSTSSKLSEVRIGLGGVFSMMMVEAKGRILARPDEDETVVISMADGKVLKRVPLGKPLLLTENLLVVTSGQNRLGFYSW